MAKFTDEDEALLAELGVEVEGDKDGLRTAREERIVSGFEEIRRFVSEHGHVPMHGENNDVFERRYALRLDRLRALEDCRALLAPLDTQGLLVVGKNESVIKTHEMDDDELLAQLGVDTEGGDVTELRHVRSAAEKRAAEEIANREVCGDFEVFKPLFEQVQRELDTGLRVTRDFVKDAGFLKADIVQGNFFVLGGQIAYVAEVGEPIKAPNGELDARLRVVYSNGTESNLLLRSLQRALYKDESGRRITDPAVGPLFADESGEGDLASGTIYVLRSKSEDEFVVAHHDILHKIGVTGGEVKQRIGNAKLDPTFLMADVEVIATYELFNINRIKLENLIHRIFDSARLNIEIKDRFGQPIVPREWFLVPLFVINEAVERIKDGTVLGYVYDPKAAALVYRG